MCKKATELQETWEPTEGDWFVLYDEIENIGDYSQDLHPINYREEFPISKKNCTWLPRVDQQIALSNMPWQEFLFEMVEYSAGISESAEIAALHSLMELLYKKEWKREDWI